MLSLGRGEKSSGESAAQGLMAAKVAAAELLQKPSSRYVSDALQALSPRVRQGESPSDGSITEATDQRVRSIHRHVMTVDLSSVCLRSRFDRRERPSNKIDIAYLYYLPFCMVFTSRDKLHQKPAPLFLDDDQVFVHGDDLKVDLAKLDAHYSLLSDEEKLRGVMSFAHYPPMMGISCFQAMGPTDEARMEEWAVRPHPITSKEDEAKS